MWKFCIDLFVGYHCEDAAVCRNRGHVIVYHVGMGRRILGDPMVFRGNGGGSVVPE